MDYDKEIISIEQAIKGPIPDKSLSVEYPGPRKEATGGRGFVIVLERLNPGERVVLLLKTNEKSAGVFMFVNEYRSAIRLADTPAVTRLLEAQPPFEKSEPQIASLLTASLEGFSRKTFGQELSDLASLLGKQASPTIITLVDHAKDAVIRGQALTSLVRLGDYSRLAEGVEFLLSEGESDSAVLNAKVELSNAMAFVKDAALAGKYFIPLMQNPSVFIRQNAVYAVRQSRLRIAVPYFIKGL